MSSTRELSEAKRQLLEKYLRAQRPEQKAVLPAVTPRPAGTPAPLSVAQQQVWLHAQMAPDVPIYNEPMTVHHRGPLDVAVLSRALTQIVRRHEAWRTTFDTVNGEPVQIVQPSPERIDLRVVDLSHLPAADREAEALRMAEEDAHHPFDLKRGPLWRATLVRMSDDEQRMFMTVHQIILDGVTAYQVFLPELRTLYTAFSNGKTSSLSPLPVQYSDYAAWQREQLSEGALNTQAEYWRKQLSGNLPVLNWPSDRPRPAVQTFRGAMYALSMPEDLIQSLRALARRESATAYMTLLAGFTALLHRYTGQEDIILGTLTAGRRRAELEKLLGYFLNPLVLRLDVSGNPTFRQLLARSRDVVLGALSNQDVPFEYLVKQLQSRRDPSRNPLFQIIVSLEPPMPELDSEWNLTQFDVTSGASKVDLYVDLDERPDGIIGPITYNPDLFDHSTICRMVSHWQTLLAAAAADPDLRLSELPLLSESERTEIVSGWNATAQACPQSTVHQLFEARAAETPEAIAVEFRGEKWTYGQLNARANQVARFLRKLGVGPDTLVAICVERSPHTVAGLLGILKAGGAYIPLDPAFPRHRLALMLADAQPKVLLTQQSLANRLPHAGQTVLLDAEWDAIESPDNLGETSGPRNLAYVIFTSGSTGTPKGVQIEHRSLVNFLTSMQREPGITPADTLLAVTTFSFDIAGLEIYLPLISGARVVLADSETSRDAARLISLIESSRATIMQATPATWRMLLDAGWAGSRRTTVLCGGEALPADLARELRRRCRALWNLYGPTETTVWSAAYKVSGQEEAFVPIGRPIANTRIYVVDANLNPVPPGNPGEIYIGGDGVSRGYLNRPDLNAEKFVADPFSGDPKARLYKTGDLGRYLSNGTIEFLGRADNQVKVRGFRIELGDIEAALSQHPAVGSAVCAVREVAPGDARLVAYVVPRRRPEPEAGDLREFLRQKLPEYMLPAHFVFLDAFPLTPNAKVDRRALPAPDASRDTGDGFVAPRDEVERRLAAIWEKVLGVAPIGARDDFFALGGHSLLAVRLFADIENAFGRKLPLATLFHASTIEQLAELLRLKKEPVNTSSRLVPIQPTGSRPPLFCVHGHFGEVLFYRPLSQHLGSDQPFYALQSHGGRQPVETLEQMAAEYITEIRRVQPHGPYHLGGYCLGAMVAFEMARQLREQGEEVAFLGLFIGYIPKLGLRERLSRRLRRHMAQLHELGLQRKAAIFGTNALQKLRSLLWRAAYGLLARFIPRSSPLFRNVPEMNLKAAKRYVPSVYAGRMTVFLSGPVPARYALDAEDIYGLDAQSVDLRLVPGESNTMLDEPHVALLAGELQRCLRDSAASRASSVVKNSAGYAADSVA